MNDLPEPEWVGDTVWWLAYPLGFVGAYPPGESGPATPDQHRLRRLLPWLPYVASHGATGVALGPIFASESHGYDTIDHFRIDPRLGDDDDFDALVAEAKRVGLRVQLDGVFHHVARSHPKVQAALADPDGEPMDWFKPWQLLSEDDASGYVDFSDDDDEIPRDDLVDFNHASPLVQDYVVNVLRYWLDRGVDSWRLDSGYQVPTSFWARVLPRVRETHPDVYFTAEVVHGDFGAFVKASTVDSVTQYELWKAIWSSLDSANLRELAWALDRHNAALETFVPTTFIGNQDTSRIASMIADRRHLPHAVVLLMMLGGTPTIYAGDPHLLRAFRDDGPRGSIDVRPEFPADPLALDATDDREVADFFATWRKLVALRHQMPWLHRAVSETLRVDDNHAVIRLRPHPSWTAPDAGGAAAGGAAACRSEADEPALRLLLNLSDEPLPRPDHIAPDIFLASDPATARLGVVQPHGWAVAAGPGGLN